MNEENVIYTYNEILFSLRKEGNSAICDHMDELGKPHDKWNKPVTERQILLGSTNIKYLK